MSAKMVRNAGDLHRAKQRAAANGQKLTEEERALCGLHEQLAALSTPAPVDKAEDESGPGGQKADCEMREVEPASSTLPRDRAASASAPAMEVGGASDGVPAKTAESSTVERSP